MVDPPGMKRGSVAAATVVPLDHEPIDSVDRMGIEPNAPTLQGSVAPLEHASPFVERSVRELNPAFVLTTDACNRNTYRPIAFQVIADGVEPSLSWMSTRRLSRWTTRSSDQGGSRTHKHEALDLAAFPVCVPSHSSGGFGGRTRQSRLMRPG